MAVQSVVITLNAVFIAIKDGAACVLSVGRRGDRRGGPLDGHALPYGPFDPAAHRTFEIGLRQWVEEQTHLKLGYVEQLYTFGDKGREAPLAALAAPSDATAAHARFVSVGYLALTPTPTDSAAPGAAWRDWRRYFPWEDWREGEPAIIQQAILPGLYGWAEKGQSKPDQAARLARVKRCFCLDAPLWEEEKVLDRYELLYEADLVQEAARDRGETPSATLGEPMISDHRRILATAIGRLRGKLRYRPIIFELMPDAFTLLELQQAVEAVSGFRFHKQNFRRMIAQSGLVERTDKMATQTGGRPAAVFRHARDGGAEKAGSGFALPRLRLGRDAELAPQAS